MGKWIAVLSVVAAAAVGPLAAPAAAFSGFDGVWYVAIVTKSGECKSGTRHPIRIQAGSLRNANDRGVTILGTVSESGEVSVSVSGEKISATGSGQLAGRSGTGQWVAGSCSGTWSAARTGNGRLATSH
jgi:hypothetical protein